VPTYLQLIEKTYFSLMPSFFVDGSGGVHLGTLGFIQINPLLSIPYSLSIIKFPQYSTAYSTVQYVIFIYRWVVSIFFIPLRQTH
jgi:hypothetical protein